jgi:hypothetical protein
MGPVIVSFDVVEIGGGLESIDIPIKLLHPSVDGRVAIPNRSNITFKVPYINRIEADLREVSQQVEKLKTVKNRRL